MSDFTIRTSTTPPATVKVQADPSFSTKQAVEAADAAAASAASADADAAATAADRIATGDDAAAAAASAAAASTDADDAAASAADAAATLASSLKKADNLSDLASAPTALTNLGLTATAAEINTLDGITASTAELNLLDGVTVTTAQINSVAQFTGRNLIINGSGRINQRGYASGAATSGANQFTLDRWFVVTSGQNLSFTGDASARVMTAPAGGVSQVIEGANIVGGTYVLNWTGTATATVGGVARAKGETFTLTANANVTVRFSSGTFSNVQLEAGSIVTPFERRTFGQELALCLRYYEKTFDYSVAPASSAGLAGVIAVSSVGTLSNTTVVNWNYVPKAVTPTIATFNPSAAGSSWRNLNANNDVAEAVGSIGLSRATIAIQGTPSDANRHAIHAVASAELTS